MMSENPYGFRRAFGIWFLATLPPLVVSWLLAPALIPWFSKVTPVKVYWLLFALATAAQLAVVAVVVRRELGGWNWAAVRGRLRLELPGSPRCLWWGAVWAAILALVTAAGLTIIMMSLGRFLTWPSYTFPLELASPGFAGQWGWIPVILLLWAAGVCAEELIFRGVLLPRTSSWFNGLLFVLYHIYKPWALPFRMLETAAIVYPARRFRSTLISMAVRGAEGLFVLGLLLAGVLAKPFPPLPDRLEFPMIGRHPAPGSIPAGVPKEAAAIGKDLRGSDLSGRDLRGASAALSLARFDDRTIWPARDRMPADFDVARIKDLGRNPGLGVRQLHARGITGREVGIAILDNPLLAEHEDYRDRLAWYEELDTGRWDGAQMHSGAVASIAVGRTIGVAPEARLYFIGIGDNLTGHGRRFSNLGRGIRRLLEINRRLPEERKIRVISISMSWSPSPAGYYEALSAFEAAKSAGVFVVSSDLATNYGFHFQGLGRPALADPERYESYGPGLWWANNEKSIRKRGRLLIPMDSRTLASPTGAGEYVFYKEGGWSWSIPYIAGVYALAAQVAPAITPKRFWKTALDTGRTIPLKRGSEDIAFGAIIDPGALVARLEKEKHTEIP